MGWQNLQDSTAEQDRIKAQQDWAKRREEHFKNPSPNVWGNIARRLGNMVSNYDLERMEKRDLDWSLADKDRQGGYVLNSPVDSARFGVYDRILKAHQEGVSPTAQDLKAWQMIKAGQVPESLVKD